MAIITDTKARNIKPDSPPIAHGGIVGLSLHPSTTKGRGKWMMRFVNPATGKRQKMGLGSYPEISIAEVSKLALPIRELLASGQDPLAARKEAKEKKQSLVPTFEEAARTRYLELQPGWKNTKHAQQWINTLTTYVFPAIGHLTLDKITPRDVMSALTPIWLSKPETASRVKQRIHSVMSWGWAHEYCQSNPVDVVSYLLPAQPSKEIRQKHMPAMAWRELPKFYNQLLDTGKSNVTRLILELTILTLARSGEVRGMCWSEIDWEDKVWTIPAERMKAKKPHRIPLNERAMDILTLQRRQHQTLVFPSPVKGTQLSDAVMTKFLKDIQAPSTDKGRYATAHGFRSSFRDWCSENGIARDVAERALAHSISNKVEAAYHRTDLLEERRKVMGQWLDFLLPQYRNANQEPG